YWFVMGMSVWLLAMLLFVTEVREKIVPLSRLIAKRFLCLSNLSVYCPILWSMYGGKQGVFV
ncbi:MAG: hypothetical protein ACRCYD_00925, partial [Plesiomonas sp.]